MPENVATKKHRKWPWILLAVILIPILVIVILFAIGASQPNVALDYETKQVTGGPIEEKNASKGSYEIESTLYKGALSEVTDKNKTEKRDIKAYYPKDTSKKYPLVVMVNGTGVPYNKYEAIFEHLASWGYVVLGNNFETMWNGKGTSETLNFALNNDFLKTKFDENEIAVGGHSQGGEGTYNAVTDFENGSKYKCLFALSATSQAIAKSLDWSHNPGTDKEYGYNLSQIHIPALMMAGTGDWDAGNKDNPEGICPLYSLNDNYNAYPEGVAVAMARRKETDHGDVLWRTDPYVTAWLEYWLKGDQEAGKAFFGNDPELASNKNWQDFKSKEK